MTAALNRVSQLIERLLESQMRRAAVRIRAGQRLFPRSTG
jgi:hypothetical protein